jgi:KilA-N domain
MIIDEVSRLRIGQSREDGYINITKMAQASGRLVADYLRLDTTEAFLKQLSASTGISVNQLILIQKGGNAKTLTSFIYMMRSLWFKDDLQLGSTTLTLLRVNAK